MFPEYPFSSHYHSVDGNRLHYVDEGDSENIVVMVHGNPTWSFYYRRLITRLSATHRVIALDNIGCGLSDKPQEYDYTLQNHIDNLQSLLDSLDITRYSLVVHDWGGAIGMGCATQYPERIERIVVLNTAAFRSSRIPFRIQVCRWPFIGPFIVRAFNGFAWPATFMAVEQPLADEVKKAYLAPYNSWRNRVAVAAFVKDIPLKSSDVSYHTLSRIETGLSHLRELEIPMLILWGGKDFCFDMQFFTEWRERFPDAEYHCFEDGGHYIVEDKFEELAPRIENFLDMRDF